MAYRIKILSFLGGTKSRVRDFVRQTGASSAVEFALLAPVLVLMTMSMFDLGGSITDRMALDAALRNGAQTAMEYGTVDEIIATMEATAETRFDADLTDFDVAEYCTCGLANGAEVSCSTTTCEGGSPNQFFRLTALFGSTSMLTPTYEMAPSITLQR